MALAAADIATLSRLLDQALELDASQHEAWLAALAPEHQRHAGALRDMLKAQAEADSDDCLSTLPKLGQDEAVARAGERVGPYSLIREIGRGGMGSVWLAARADGNFRRDVALKLPRLAWGAGLAERMAREREIGALLEHPNIARLYDAGLDDRGRPFIAMEYIDGQPIDAWCRDHALGARARLELFVQVVRAVAYAHGRLVIHRDLKPANVLVDAKGQTHLLDFGIAKLIDGAAVGSNLTQEQGRVMTPVYASPEQIEGRPVGVATDVYSLGVMSYELLTGVLPHAPKRSSLGAIEEAILQGDAPVASSRVQERATAGALRGEVDSILGKAMKRAPDDRYATADALADDLERHLAGEAVRAQPDSAWYRTRKALRRHRTGVAATITILLAILAGAGISLVQAHRATKAALRQQLVPAFVSDVFRVGLAPGAAGASDASLTADRFLQQGAKLIADRFPGEPALQAELYGIVGRQFLEMGAAEEASDYASRQVDALALIGADAAMRAAALTTLAQALIERGRFEDAENRAKQAIDLAHGHADLQADATAALLRALMFLGSNAEALRVADRLASLTQRLGKETTAEAWMYAMHGWLLSRLNRYPESGPLYDRAIGMALRVEGELSRAAADMRSARGWQMINHGDAAASKVLHDAAFQALRQRGGASAIAAETRAAKTWSRYYSVKVAGYAEASSVVERAQHVLASQPNVPEVMRSNVDFERGSLALAFGDLQVAQRWMDKSAESVLKSDDSPFRQIQIVTGLAYEAMLAGQHDRAAELIDQRSALRGVIGERDHPYALYDHVQRGLNASMAGRHTQALAMLEAMPRFAELSAGGSIAAGLRDIGVWAKARILADHGEMTAAWRLIEHLQPEEGRDDGVFSQHALRAELRCAMGQPAEGKTRLEALADSAAVDHYEHAPVPAWLRAKAGLCALAAGERARARQLAMRAHKAFEAQPEVSDYFKRPLLKLEQALRQ